jgi:hypothetical protein
MALPTCSVRALPEHHQLLRQIGRALATQPVWPSRWMP